jgi:uracil-DNA glycosylase
MRSTGTVQRSMRDFFAKRPAADKAAGSPPPSPARKRPAVAAQAAEVATVTTVAAPQPSASPAPSLPPPPPPPRDRAAAREAATAAMALAAQRATAATSNGTHPALADLLVDEGWRAALGGALTPRACAPLQRFLEAEWARGGPVYPPRHLIFRALNEVPLDAVRVVIIGQVCGCGWLFVFLVPRADSNTPRPRRPPARLTITTTHLSPTHTSSQDPYHGPGQAEGLAFSVPRGVAVPPSLRNVHKELASDVPASLPRPPPHGSLAAWAAQGVLLLNATLTVRGGAANSHAGKGWEAVTDAAIAAVAARPAPAVFLLWGKFAQAKAGLVRKHGRHHTILEAPHPSGLSAHRGFFGCRHFSSANAALVAAGGEPIDWRVD